MAKKHQYEPMTHEERVSITKEAIKLAFVEFLENRKREIDKSLLGFFKRLLWYLGTALMLGIIHLMLHGKYQKIAEIIVNAFGS